MDRGYQRLAVSVFTFLITCLFSFSIFAQNPVPAEDQRVEAICLACNGWANTYNSTLDAIDTIKQAIANDTKAGKMPQVVIEQLALQKLIAKKNDALQGFIACEKNKCNVRLIRTELKIYKPALRQKPNKLADINSPCKSCQDAIKEYNKMIDELYDHQKKAYQDYLDRGAAAQFVQLDQADLKAWDDWKAANPNVTLTKEEQELYDETKENLEKAKKKQEDANTALKEEDKKAEELNKKVENKRQEIEKCDESKCPSHGQVIPPTKTSTKTETAFLPKTTEIGVLGGVTGGNLSGQINTTVGGVVAGDPTFSASHSSYIGEAGLQVKLIYDLANKAQPFIYLNGSSAFSSSNTMNFGKINSTTLNSTLVVNNNWNARVGVGLQTEPLYNQIQLGAGVAMAFVNQTLKANIGETTTTTFSNQQVSFGPSVMGLVSWQFCQNCFAGHGAILAFQLNFDNVSKLSVNGVAPSGITYHSSVSSAWQPHGDLIFSVPLS